MFIWDWQLEKQNFTECIKFPCVMFKKLQLIFDVNLCKCKRKGGLFVWTSVISWDKHAKWFYSRISCLNGSSIGNPPKHKMTIDCFVLLSPKHMFHLWVCLDVCVWINQWFLNACFNKSKLNKAQKHSKQ